MAVKRPAGVAEQGFVWDLHGVHPPADGLLGVDQGFQSARRPVHLAEQQVQTLGALGGPLHAARGRALAPVGPDRGKGLGCQGSLAYGSIQFLHQNFIREPIIMQNWNARGEATEQELCYR